MPLTSLSSMRQSLPRRSVSASAASSRSAQDSVTSSTTAEATAAAYAHSQLQRSRSLPPVSSVRHFPSISITPEEQAHYDRVVGRLLYRAVQEHASIGGKVDPKVWAPVRRKRDMTIYKSLKGGSEVGLSLMLGLGEIDGSLEDVMDGLYAETAQEVRAVKAFLKSKCIAGTVLQVSERRSPDDPFNFAGIKWFAAKTPGGPVSYDRDLLTYERQGMTLDADGNEIAYHLLQSIDRPEWPANTFKGLIRAFSSICYLYKRKGERVETFFYGEFFASGSFPQRISDYGIAGKWLSVVNAVRCSHARKLSQLKSHATTSSMRSSTSSMTLAESTACNGCHEEKRTPFSTYYLCAGCQQTVCNCCSKEEKLFELDKTGRPLTDRFCKHCIAKVAKQPGSKIYWDGAFETVESHPAYFDHMFHYSSLSSRLTSDASSSESTILSDVNLAGVACLGDGSYTRGELDSMSSFASSCYGDYRARYDSDADELLRQRRQSCADRISIASYSKEQLMVDLFPK